MRLFLAWFLLISFSVRVHAQGYYFPPLTGSAWDTIQPSSLSWCSDRIDSLYDFLGANNSKAFILMKDGKIVLEKYFGTFTSDSLWYWASAGKTLTGFLVGIAQQEGALSISNPVSQYLGQGWTSCTPQQEALITVKNQLSMTTGLDDGFGNSDCWDDSCLVYLSNPGTRWAYHNAPYTLLDQVISQATSQTLNAFLTSRVRVPTGMDGFYLQIGYNNVFFSKARSMARFASLLMNRGVWNANTIMTDTAYFHDMVNPSSTLNLSYGYLTWLNGQTSFMAPGSQIVFPGMLLPQAPPDVFAAIGKNGQIINCSPSTGISWIRMGDAPGTTVSVPIVFNDEVWERINLLPCLTAFDDRVVTSSSDLTPNPVTDVLTVRNLPSSNTEFSILDVSGRIWLRGIMQGNSIQLSELPNGFYILKIKAGEGSAKALRFLKS